MAKRPPGKNQSGSSETPAASEEARKSAAWSELNGGNGASESKEKSKVSTNGDKIVVDVTERRRAEEALRGSEKRMRTLADSLPQIIWTNSSDGTANYFNQRWYEYSGLSFEESAGPGWEAIIHPDDAPMSKKAWQEALAAGEVFDTEYRLRRRDGTYRWFIGRNVPDRNAEGRVMGWFGTATDIHDLKEAEAATSASEEQFRRAIEDAPIPMIMHAEDGQVLQISKTWTELTGYAAEDIPTFEAWLNRAYGPGADEVRDHVHKLFQDEGTVLNTEIGFTTKAGEHRRWSFSASAPGRLRDGRRFIIGMARDITERMETEKALRETEERFRQFAENSADVFWIMDAKTQEVEYLNPVYEKIFGQKLELLFQDRENRIKLVPPEDREEATKGINHALEGKTFVRNYRIVRPSDGQLRWIRDTGFPIRDATGQVVRIAGVAQDVTEEREYTEALRQNREMFSALVENAPFGVYLVDAQFRLSAINAGSKKVFGGIDPLIGRDFAEILHILWPEPFASEAIGRFRHTLETGEPFVSPPIVEKRANINEIQSYDWQLHRVKLPDATYGVVCYFYDLSTQKKLEATMRESEEKLRLLIEGAPDYAMFLIDPKNTITYWSAGAEKVFGWSAEEAIGQTGALIFTPEDRKKGAAEKELGTARSKGFAPDRRWHLRKDGSRLWVDGIMRRLDRSDGSIRGYAKIGRDATDLRESEDALLRARDEMEQRVVERTAELVAMNNELEGAMRARQQLERELLDISEREKRRIGEDLHDIICQELSAAALYLKSNANRVEKKNPAAAKTLTDAANIVNRNVTLARNLARGFQPVQLSGGHFTAALRALVSQMNKSRRDITCRAEIPRTLHIADEAVALNLYRIAQEAITNAIKHSGADEVVLFLKREGNQVQLRVEDNGSGFRARKRSKGLGMHIMQYRTTVMGGTMTVETNPKKGTRITSVVPVRSSVREAD